MAYCPWCQACWVWAKKVGLALGGAYLNLDAGFDATRNRKCMFNAGMIPNITENPRHRKTPKRGRKRFFNATIHALRTRVDRAFAWEDKFKRLFLRFEPSSAAALWHEVTGVYLDQCASVLRCLKLATSSPFDR